MKLKYEDLKIDVQRARYNDEYPSRTRGTFVTIKHVPTGIEVTKYHRVAMIAKGEALEELEKLVFNAEPIK